MRENNYYHVNKKTRLEVEQDDMMQQQQQQQNFQYHDPTEQDRQLQAWTRQQNQFLQSLSQSQRPYLPQQQYIQHQDPTVRNPLLQALFHKHRLIRQHQQTLQSMSPYQRLQFQQQQQMRRLLLQQGVQRIPSNVCPFGGGMCGYQKFMMFLYHMKQRPEDNCITFWREFVAEYFSPRAKQRLCFSQYKGAGHMLGTLPQGMWQCNLCGTKSGKGVEATYDVLARLFEIKFASGFVNELLSLEDPRECRLSSGLIVLEYRKLVQTIEYEECRVVHEGPFRIIFSQDLKILRWEFCARRHEEFLPRRLIAPKVNQFLQVAQKFQNTISESGSKGVSRQDLQTDSNMVLGARRQLANSMEPMSLTDLGYPKKYVRALQTYELVKSMKELMDFTENHKIGPIEGLKRLSEQTATMRLQRQQMQEMEQFENSGAMNRSAQAQMDGLTGNNNNYSNNHHHSSAQAAAALTNNQIMLMRRLNAMNDQNSKTGKHEGFSTQSLAPNFSAQSLAPNNNNYSNNHHHSSAQAAAALTNNQIMLMRLNAMNDQNSKTGKHEGFSTQSLAPNSNQSPYWSHQRQNLATGGFLSSPQMQQQQRTMHGTPNTLQNTYLPVDATEIPEEFSDDNFLNDSDK